MVDIEELKRKWRAECEKRGIDPVEGATAVQVTLYNAERRKRMHDRYSSVMTLLHYARHPELIPAAGVGWRARKDWWTRETYWRNTPSPRMTHCFTYVPERVPLHSNAGQVEDAAIRAVRLAAWQAQKARMVEAVYNHPPKGARHVTRSFKVNAALRGVMREDLTGEKLIVRLE